MLISVIDNPMNMQQLSLKAAPIVRFGNERTLLVASQYWRSVNTSRPTGRLDRRRARALSDFLGVVMSRCWNANAFMWVTSMSSSPTCIGQLLLRLRVFCSMAGGWGSWWCVGTHLLEDDREAAVETHELDHGH